MPGEATTEEPQFLEYLRVLRRRKWWILTALLIGVAGAAAFSLTEAKQYTPSATVLVTSTPTVDANVSSGTISNQQLQTDADLFQTLQIESAVRKSLGQKPYPVTATAALTDDLITVQATGPSANFAARTANAYADAFITNQRKTARADGAAAASSIATQLSSLSSQVRSLQKQYNATAPGSSQGTALQAQIGALETQEAALSGERAQVLIAAQLASGGVTLSSRATPPPFPSSPKPKTDIFLGGIAGLILGLGMALGIDAIDDRVQSREDVERAYPRLPLLGFVPFIESWKAVRRPYLVSLAAPVSSAAEAFRSVRTALQFVRIDRELKVILVTSSIPGEGKTATVANLGVAIARAGRTVCVVSADLRRPRLDSFLTQSDDVGITSVAIGDISLERAIHQVGDVPGLWYLGTGPRPGEASEFLGSSRAAEIFSELRERFDIVLIDSPPLLAVADSLVMTAYSDGVVLVVRQGSTRRRSLARMRELLEQSDAEVIGAILGEEAPGTFEQYGGGYRGRYGRYGGYYGTYYGYGYGADGRDGAKSRRHAARNGRKKDEQQKGPQRPLPPGELQGRDAAARP